MLPDLPKIPVGTTWDEDTGKIELASPTVTMWSEESPDPGMTEAAEMETIKTETAEAKKTKVPLEEPAADGHDGPVYNGKRMRTARGYMQDYDIPNEQVYREVYLYTASLADMLCRLKVDAGVAHSVATHPSPNGRAYALDIVGQLHEKIVAGDFTNPSAFVVNVMKRKKHLLRAMPSSDYHVPPPPTQPETDWQSAWSKGDWRRWEHQSRQESRQESWHVKRSKSMDPRDDRNSWDGRDDRDRDRGDNPTWDRRDDRNRDRRDDRDRDRRDDPDRRDERRYYDRDDRVRDGDWNRDSRERFQNRR
ncbi:unnamed protein product [Symbiodinium sp. CCMP2592]|nr:unnamed protein product [Symbiodinium sp. CCMP2592]